MLCKKHFATDLYIYDLCSHFLLNNICCHYIPATSKFQGAYIRCIYHSLYGQLATEPNACSTGWPAGCCRTYTVAGALTVGLAVLHAADCCSRKLSQEAHLHCSGHSNALVVFTAAESEYSSSAVLRGRRRKREWLGGHVMFELRARD